MSDRTDLNALLGSRICHDLISPIGAIGNGVELLIMDGATKGPEIALIAESVANASARIRFFRIGFGASGRNGGYAVPHFPGALRPSAVEKLLGPRKGQALNALVSTGPDRVAELVRRYAASLGISGQVAASDKILEPLLYKSDRAAWRYKAFILAMNNKQADAKKVAEQTMPAQLAGAITPYMQKMPYLTAAQKAAAVHFGHFPQQIGTSIAAITPTPPAPACCCRGSPPWPAPAPCWRPTPRTWTWTPSRRPPPGRRTSLACTSSAPPT